MIIYGVALLAFCFLKRTILPGTRDLISMIYASCDSISTTVFFFNICISCKLLPKTVCVG